MKKICFFLFFKFESSEKSICLEGPKEVVKVFDKRAGPNMNMNI